MPSNIPAVLHGNQLDANVSSAEICKNLSPAKTSSPLSAFYIGGFMFMEESRDKSWHNIYIYPLLRCSNFHDFKSCTFDFVTHPKQRPLVQVSKEKQGIDSPLLSPPLQHYAANVEKLPGFRAGIQTQLKILRSLPKA